MVGIVDEYINYGIQQFIVSKALECIKDLPFDGPGGDDFHCSFFSATHIIYALGAHYLCVTVGAFDQNERKRLPMVVSIFTY